MKQYILIYDVIRIGELQYKSHYRAYDENKVCFAEDDYIYTIIKPRKMSPGYLKGKITTGIHHKLSAQGLMEYKTSMRTTCLVTNAVIAQEMADKKYEKPVKEEIKETFTKRIEVDDNPRIYRVVLINGNYTIVKAETQYLTREQAKEELFKRQLEEA